MSEIIIIIKSNALDGQSIKKIDTFRTYSRNLEQRSTLAKKGTFFEKRAPKLA